MKTLLICLLLAMAACSEDASPTETARDAAASDGATDGAAPDAADPDAAGRADAADAGPQCGADGCPDARPDGGPDAADAGPEPADGASRPDDAAAGDAAPDPNGGLPSCAEVWAAAEIRVAADARPADPAMRLTFTYGRDGAEAWISLDRVEGERVVRESDGPFSVEENSGSWVELHDANGATLYTRGVFELVSESIEVPPGPPGSDAGFMRLSRCPDGGFIRLQNLPNDPAATQVVFYQSAIDGDPGGPTVEVARFALP